MYQEIEASGHMVLMQRLWALRMLQGDNMAEHLNKFRVLANQVDSLSGNGEGIEKNELVILLSLSVLESFKSVIMAL